MSHLLILEIAVGTNLDVRVGNGRAILRHTAQVGNLVLVVGDVIVEHPVELFALDGLPADAGLDTLVLERTDVLPSLVAVSREGLGGSIVQQVGSLALVEVDRT